MTKFKFPEKCPACSKKLTYYNEHWVYCEEGTKEEIPHFGLRINEFDEISFTSSKLGVSRTIIPQDRVDEFDFDRWFKLRSFE